MEQSSRRSRPRSSARRVGSRCSTAELIVIAELGPRPHPEGVMPVWALVRTVSMRRDTADRFEEAVGLVGLTVWKFNPAGGAQSALDPLEWLQ